MLYFRLSKRRIHTVQRYVFNTKLFTKIKLDFLIRNEKLNLNIAIIKATLNISNMKPA